MAAVDQTIYKIMGIIVDVMSKAIIINNWTENSKYGSFDSTHKSN